MPTDKQNTFTNRTLPEAIVVSVHDDQPVSLVGAFESPVRATETSGYLTASVEALSAYARTIEDNYGLSPLTRLVISLKDSDTVAALNERVAFTDLAGRVRDAVAPLVNAEEQDS